LKRNRPLVKLERNRPLVKLERNRPLRAPRLGSEGNMKVVLEQLAQEGVDLILASGGPL
jgi:hypothetical protein